MVKNDALFSYVAPGNIIAWMLTPLRYVLPIRQFVVLNRTVIKFTHFPLLFCIFLYEKYFLASSIYEPTDLVENQGRQRNRGISFTDPASRGAALFSPNMRTHEESVAGIQKDRALDEVFRRPPDVSTIRNQRRQERRKTQTAIRNWMDQNDEIGERLSHWPTIDSRPSPSQRRMSMSRDYPKRFRHVSDIRSAASDPADLASNSAFPLFNTRELNGQIDKQQAQYQDQTEADGDDEFVTNDEEEDDAGVASRRGSKAAEQEQEDYFTTSTLRRGTVNPSSLGSSPRHQHSSMASPRAGNPSRRQGLHSRTMSTNTILYAPQGSGRYALSPSSISEEPSGVPSRPRPGRLTIPVETSEKSGTKSPRKIQNGSNVPVRPRPIPARSVPNRSSLTAADPRIRKLSSIDADISSDMGLDVHNFGAVPSSFATQMAMATGQLKAWNQAGRDRDDADRMSRLVLARMKTLEEGFADVVKEMRVMRSAAPTAQNSGDDLSFKTGTSSEIPSSSKGRLSKVASERSRPGSARDQKAGLGTVTPQSQKAKGKNKGKGKGKEMAKSWSRSQSESEGSGSL